MASYTDQLPQFNPYIQQLPVEAMVQVGMEKQRRYDEGIQKIQTNIDNIAGLDVVRDVDKKYLQSKLNELGSKLRTVAAGDFSNYQLVNSVGGMTKQIGKDSAIQNAVSSTARYKKGLADMEQAIKEGKAGASNNWLFNQEASAWLNSEDVNTSFSGGYKPYTNYKKNALEVIKSLTKSQDIKDTAFTVDAKGNMVITDSMVRRKLAGISPEQIQQALLAGLTPDDFKQMEIDGRYAYSNLSPEAFKQKVESSYRNKEEAFTSQKAKLEAAISQTTSNVERNVLKSQIQSLNKVLENTRNEYKNVTSTFANGDVESAKAKLETINFLTGFSKAFSFTETSETEETNPRAEMQMKREINNQNWREFTMKFAQEERKMAQDYNLAMLDIAEKRKANDLKSKEIEGYGGLPAGRDKDSVPQFTLAGVVARVEQGDREITALDNAFMQQQGKDQNWLDEQKLAWEKNPKGVDPLISTHFDKTEKIRRTVEADKVMISDINKAAEKQIDPSTGKPLGNIYSYIPKDAPNINATVDGKFYTFSPKDFVDFNQTFTRYNKYLIGEGPGASGSFTFDDKKASEELSDKELFLYNIYKKRVQGKPLSSAERIITDNAKNYNKIVNLPFAKSLDKINKYTAEEVTRRLTSSQAVEYEVPTASTAQKESFATLLTRYANRADDQKGKIAGSPDFNPTLARALAVDPNLKGSIKVVEGSEIEPAMYELSATGKGGTIRVRMTPEEKIAVFGDRFDSSPATQMAKPYLDQIRKMGGTSTALSPGESTHRNAFLTPIDFPNVSIYGVKANIVKSDGGYSIRISGFDPVTKEWQDNIPYPRTGLLSEDRIAEALINLNDAAMYELINDKAPTTQDLNRVIQASKKPF